MVPELLRHANVSVTMNIYAQGLTELKRHAHTRIVRIVDGGKSEASNVLKDAHARQLLGLCLLSLFYYGVPDGI